MDLSVRSGSPAAPIKTEIPEDVDDVRSSPDASVTRLSRSPSPSPVKRERSQGQDNGRPQSDSTAANPFLKLFPQVDTRGSAPTFPAMMHGHLGGN